MILKGLVKCQKMTSSYNNILAKFLKRQKQSTDGDKQGIYAVILPPTFGFIVRFLGYLIVGGIRVLKHIMIKVLASLGNSKHFLFPPIYLHLKSYRTNNK